MTTASYRAAVGPRRSSAARVCGGFRESVRAIDVIAETARALWGRKTAVELKTRTRISLRSCEYILAKQCGLSADALCDLLRSEDGFAFLERLIEHSPPTWWSDFKAQVELGRTERKVVELERELSRIRREKIV